MLSQAYYLHFPASLSIKGLFVSAVTDLGLRVRSLSAPLASVRHGVCCIFHFLARVCQKETLIIVSMFIKNTQWHIWWHLPLMIPFGVVSELVFTQESVWLTAWENHLVLRESVDKTSSKKTPRHGFCLLCSHRQQTATVCQVLMAHSHYQGILFCASQELLSLAATHACSNQEILCK